MSIRSKHPLRLIKFCFILPMILAFAGWIYLSLPVAHLSLSKTQRCTLEFHRWYSGSCMLSYYENDNRAGTVKLHSDYFNNPIAFFPGRDGHSVICFSFLDTTYATFVIDFTKRNAHPDVIDLPLVVRAEPVVDRSDFAVRPCTEEEVDRLAQFLRTTDLFSLSHLVRGSVTSETREDLLKHLEWSTGRWVSASTDLQFSKPQILPTD
jgi:hypothetical protein